MINMTEWAMKCLNKGQIEEIIDPHLSRLIRTKSLEKFVETAVKCLADYGVDRPTMGDVLWSLEYSLQLQGSVPTTSKMDSLNEVAQLSSEVHEGKSGLKDNLSDASMSNVFSQLMESEGR
ncbi:hypothetical protein HPP92_015565 [Vanilla planifolia]|nr:hypothetical protein HPP92_015565 [Vanilla planifolia]